MRQQNFDADGGRDRKITFILISKSIFHNDLNQHNVNSINSI